MSRSDRWTAVLLGGSFVALGLGLAIVGFVQMHGPVDWLVLATLVALYAVAFHTEFESGVGSAVPTQPVLVGMLFLLPVSFVPMAVLIGQTLRLPARGQSKSLHEYLVGAIAGWHCLGAVGLLWLADEGAPSLARWPLYLAALAAQFGVDVFTASIRAVALGTRLGDLVAPMRWTFLVDSLLAVVGLSAVLATGGSAATVLFLAAPVALVWVLSRDRRVKVEEAQTLGQAVELAREEARIDPLTQLVNRRAWREAVSIAASRFVTEPDRTLLTVVFIDLDRLKLANDTLGHEVGDALISAMAVCLRAAAPESATIARLGGDEFGVLLVENADGVVGAGLVDTIRRTVAARAPIQGFALSASIGVASCPPEEHPVAALRLADELAFRDKLERRAQRTSESLHG